MNLDEQSMRRVGEVVRTVENGRKSKLAGGYASPADLGGDDASAASEYTGPFRVSADGNNGFTVTDEAYCTSSAYSGVFYELGGINPQSLFVNVAGIDPNTFGFINVRSILLFYIVSSAGTISRRHRGAIVDGSVLIGESSNPTPLVRMNHIYDAQDGESWQLAGRDQLRLLTIEDQNDANSGWFSEGTMVPFAVLLPGTANGVGGLSPLALADSYFQGAKIVQLLYGAAKI